LGIFLSTVASIPPLTDFPFLFGKTISQIPAYFHFLGFFKLHISKLFKIPKILEK
jgi:hypothetical protein